MIDQRFYEPLPKDVWIGRASSTPLRLYQQVTTLDITALPTLSRPGYGLLGFACDAGVVRNQGRAGAKQGPNSWRKAAGGLCWHGRDPLLLFDLGNILCPQNEDLEKAQTLLGQAVTAVLQAGLVSVVIGGGHETAWGHLQGIYKNLGKGQRLGIINFDAHFDLRPLREGLGNSGTPFLQAAQFCEENGFIFDYTCLGIQPLGNDRELFHTAKNKKVCWVTAEEMFLDLTKAKQAISECLKRCDVVYVSVCMDVFSQALAPGVSAPQPLGLTWLQFFPLWKELASSSQIVAIDVVELSPPLDLGDQTAKFAASIVGYFWHWCSV